ALRALGYIGGVQDQDLVSGAGKEHPHVMEHLKTGIFFFLRDSISASEKEIRTTLAMSPNNITARKYLGSILFMQEKYIEAARVLRSILGKTKADAEVRLILSQCLLKSDKKDEGLEQLKRIPGERMADPQIAFKAANILFQAGEFKTAGNILEQTIEKRPDKLNVMRQATGLHFQYKNWPAARKLLIRELTMEPTLPAYLLLSDVSTNMGRLDEARQILEKVLGYGVPDNIRPRVEKQLETLKERIRKEGKN
ncbi:MAG: tetratricopeptide repeat protein, partial [Gemmatimonadota bacterium]|nr:tetratricopeptide repeat protein [Gemmatimonadota bacterium]